MEQSVMPAPLDSGREHPRFLPHPDVVLGKLASEPFDALDLIAFPVTFGDFVTLDEKHPALSDSKIGA